MWQTNEPAPNQHILIFDGTNQRIILSNDWETQPWQHLPPDPPPEKGLAHWKAMREALSMYMEANYNPSTDIYEVPSHIFQFALEIEVI